MSALTTADVREVRERTQLSYPPVPINRNVPGRLSPPCCGNVVLFTARAWDAAGWADRKCPTSPRGWGGGGEPVAEPGCSWCKERAVATCAGEAEEGSRAVTASTRSQLGTQGLLQRRLHSGSRKACQARRGLLSRRFVIISYT